jgi:hypothetical protein
MPCLVRVINPPVFNCILVNTQPDCRDLPVGGRSRAVWHLYQEAGFPGNQQAYRAGPDEPGTMTDPYTFPFVTASQEPI